jgi:apolipoprotein N-acyltransferase
MFNNHANGSFRLLIPVFIAIYCALYSGVWFFLANLFSKYFKYKSLAIFFSWAIFSYLYFIWIKYGVFCVFGEFFGYPFSYPLLPMASKVSNLYFLSFFGKSAFLVFVILFSQFIALFLIYFKKKYFICAIVFLVPFVFGNFFSGYNNKYKNFIFKKENFGYINPVSAQEFERPIDYAQEIYYKMVDLLRKKPEIKAIVMPESSCQFCLNKHKFVIDLWTKNILHNNVDLFIGAPYQEGVKIYNALYYISCGKIKKIYKKINLMPFAEYVPKFWNNFECFKKLFFQDSGFCCGCDKKVIFNYCENITFRPLICSDFFTIKKRDSNCFFNSSNETLLLPVNDSIFQANYLRDLMLLHAKLEAARFGINILYVGYYFLAFISRDGNHIII